MKPAKQKRSQRTLAKILSAAIDLFEKQGVDATGISDVAKAASSSVGSLYGRFDGKTDLVQAVDRLLWDRVTARWSTHPESSADSATASLLDRLSAALTPEHSARASIDEYLKRESAVSTAEAAIAALEEEVQDILASELSPTSSNPGVLGLLSHLAVSEANAGRGGDASADDVAQMSAGDRLSGTASSDQLGFIIDATLAQLGGDIPAAPKQQKREAPAVDPFDVWA